MYRLIRCIAFLIVLVGMATSRLHAAIVTYDASSGLLPQDVGWTYTDEMTPASSAVVSGGVLTFDTPLTNRAYWNIVPVPATPGSQGVFMESQVHVVSESHQTIPLPNRGLNLVSVGNADGVTASSINLSAWEDRIFVNDDLTDTMIATFLMDTTDAFHTYRVELLSDQYWVFVDNSLVLAGTTSTMPYGFDVISVEFGDHTIYSGSVSEWTNVRGGSLADIGGPTVPEPSSLVLLGIGGVGLVSVKRRRNSRLHERVVASARTLNSIGKT